MTQESYPFDANGAAGTGGTAQVLEGEWQRMARAWLTTGVVLGTADEAGALLVTANGGALQVSLAAGLANVESFTYRNDAALVLPIGAADATNPRLDTVVVRLDRAANNAQAFVKQGVAAASPVPPALTQTDLLWEMPLAEVRVNAGVGVITAAMVADRRRFAGAPSPLFLYPTTTNALLVRAASGLDVASVSASGRAHGTYLAAGALTFGDDVTLGVVNDAGTKHGLVIRAHPAQSVPLMLLQGLNNGALWTITPTATAMLDRRFALGAADAASVVSLVRRDADTGDFLTASDATTGVLFRVTNLGGLQISQSASIGPVSGIGNLLQITGFTNNELGQIVLGRDSNGGPFIAGNDVNKTLAIQAAGRNITRGGSVSIGSSVSVNTPTSGALTVSQGDNVPGQPQFSVGNDGTAVVGTNRAAWLRLTGPGVKHMEATWTPGVNELRFWTTAGVPFDGNAALAAAAFTVVSAAATKRDVQTLAVTLPPRTLAQKAAAGAGAQRSALARLGDLRPVSYRQRNDKPTDRLLHSFVAEEVALVLPEVVPLDAEGAPAGIDQGALLTFTVAALQDALGRIAKLEAAQPPPASQPQPAPAPA